MFFLLLFGCVEDLVLPFAGDCSNVPDGMYEYGQIGIGTCLAGPTKLQFIERTDSWDLYIVNSNPYLSFTGGSLQHIRWEDIDLEDPIQFTHEVTNTALPLPSFAYDMSHVDHSDGSITSIVGSRLSEGARTKEKDDYLYLFDLTESTPSYSSKGLYSFPNLDIDDTLFTKHLDETTQNSIQNTTGNALQVKQDPLGISTHNASGRIFVSNNTSADISMLVATDEGISVESPRLQEILSQSFFTDVEESINHESYASMVNFSRITQDMLLDQEADIPPLTDDLWKMTWIEGSWRFWINSSEGYFRGFSNGDDTLVIDNLGVELSTEILFGSGISGQITDAFYLDGLMYFIYNDNIHYAVWNSSAAQWEYFDLVLNEELSIDSPSMTIITPEDINEEIESAKLFYLYGSNTIYSSTYNFIDNQVTSKEMILDLDRIIQDVEEAQDESTQDESSQDEGTEYENAQIKNPFVRYDSLTDTWLLSISFFDGLQWNTIFYRSLDLINWEYLEWRLPTPSTDELVGSENDEGAEYTTHKTGTKISFESDRIRVWFASAVTESSGEEFDEDGQESNEDESVLWYLFYTESFDGISFTEPQKIWENALVGSIGNFPDFALQAYPAGNFRLEGESAGVQDGVVEVTKEYALTNFGWKSSILVGSYKDETWFGANSAGGVQIDSILWKENFAYLTIKDGAGFSKIALAEKSIEGNWIARDANSLDIDNTVSVSSPVVWEEDDGYHMLFRHEESGLFSIKEAVSVDGLDWIISDASPWSPSESWLSENVIPSSVHVSQNGEILLFFSAFDGRTWQVGMAQKQNDQWALLSEQPVIENGYPGEWNDSGVKDPYVLFEDQDGSYIMHLWYSGFDGSNWRVGYMRSETLLSNDDSSSILSAFSLPFVHPTNISQEKRPILDHSGLFFTSAAQRPLPYEVPQNMSFLWSSSEEIPSGQAFRFFFSGIHDEIPRIGRGVSSIPDRARVHYQSLNKGDHLSFFTRYGSEEDDSIVISGTYEDINLTGYAATDSVIDEDEGFLYLVSTSSPHIVIIDIQNDGQELQQDLIEETLEEITLGQNPDMYIDRNYLGIEGIITTETVAGAVGFRDILIHKNENGQKILYAINDAPEGVYSYDISNIHDTDTAVVHNNLLSDFMIAEMGVERDAEYNTQQNVGPGQMAMHPDGNYLAISNFNANSVTLFDMENKHPLTEWRNVGENPYALTFSPDGNQLIVSTYTGDFDLEFQRGKTNFGLASSTIWIYNTDPNASNFLDVHTKIQNK